MNGFVPTRPTPMESKPNRPDSTCLPDTDQRRQPDDDAAHRNGLNGGMGMGGLNSNQLIQSQPTGMLFVGLNPPVPNLPPMYSNPPQQQQATKSFNPSDIFGQMKTGQFAQNSLSTGPAAPQDPNKYNALRAQPTGFGTNGGNFTQQFMPNNNNIQQQQQQQQQQSGMMMVQPLTAQPTGFAPGGYLINQQTGHIPPNQNQPFFNNQQNQQWRGY
ncbi:hypothetical protein H4Q26_016474 [Puccinia striiformis f. sp. tritici PST-130]|nr:hypothetical protein H4Q26_016474 [Puccinia striiformis f. sp. tritici PST-130]